MVIDWAVAISHPNISHRGHPELSARFTDVDTSLSRLDGNSHVKTKDLLVFCCWKPCSRPTSISLSRVSGYHQADSGKSERLRASLDRREATPAPVVGPIFGHSSDRLVHQLCPCLVALSLCTMHRTENSLHHVSRRSSIAHSQSSVHSGSIVAHAYA